ncbi:MAG: SBBP repeat-containing protein [Chloroflexota bacterium]|nr:SBBP repeat-containing protein [Chloroflexota bacterium]
MLVRSSNIITLKRPALAVIAAALAVGFPALHVALPATAANNAPAAASSAAASLAGQLHVVQPAKASFRFEPNRGQTDPSVLYVAHAEGSLLYFKPSEVAMSLPAQYENKSVPPQPSPARSVTLKFLQSSGASLSVAGPLASEVNYIVGSDPGKWLKKIPTYSTITYSHLYTGVDLRYEGISGKGAELKGTYTIAPGADPLAIRWLYQGAGAISLDSAGNLLVPAVGAGSSGTVITEHAPVAWQESAQGRVPVEAHYTTGSRDGSIGFALGSYDGSKTLTIDPALTYSTYLGGTIDDYGNDIATDGQGNAYVVGMTNSADFPTLNPIQANKFAQSDVFVSKFNADGTLAFSTYLGGQNIDAGYGIAVDPAGAIYITGQTSSNNFPVVNAYQPSPGLNEDVFVSKLSNNGQTLLYSTYLGGAGNEYAYGIAADSAGNAFVQGYTYSDTFPVRNAYQAARAGNFDAFVTRLNTNAAGDGSLVYSTYLGGSGVDYGSGTGISAVGHGVATNGTGKVYVTGSTYSDHFPSRNGYQPVRNPSAGSDVWVAALDTSASGDPSLLYASFLGGSNSDAGRDVALDGAGNVYLTGNATSNDFPLRNSMGACTTNTQPFVAKFNMSLSGDASLIYSTCFGATYTGEASGIVVSPAGEATIVGSNASSNWPLVNQISGWHGANDVILAKLSASGNSLIYSTFLGGASNDYGRGIARDNNDYLYIAGQTQSTDYPTLNPFQAAQHGGGDAFATRIDECPVSFIDVPTTAYFYQPVRYLSCRGVISGYGDSTFRPSNTTTRGQLTKIVVLGFSLPIYAPATATFNDVPVGSTFYTYAETAVHYGLITGYACGGLNEPCPGTYFRPGASVSRAQLSKIAVKAAVQVRGWTINNPPQATFNDVPTDNTFYPYVETAVCHGMIGGYACGSPTEPCPGTYFRPGNSATRGQISKIVYQAITSTASCATGAESPSPPKLPPGK